MKYSTTIEHFQDSPIWGFHMPVSHEVAEQFIEGNDRRIICTINGQETIQAALMPSPLGYFIMTNKKLVGKLGLYAGASVELVIEKDTSEYGLDMPDELRELLNQDDEGSDHFHALTKGKQRSLIYIVAKVKNTNSRLNKALAIVHHLKEFQGKLDFKALNETIKYYNNL
ncbi:MAG: YdeI/OmpD-associated family protein [Cytophagales bacterium]|nr:YdeI/OmpD-associated family protein [Cytophagales bacterium]